VTVQIVQIGYSAEDARVLGAGWTLLCRGPSGVLNPAQIVIVNFTYDLHGNRTSETISGHNEYGYNHADRPFAYDSGGTPHRPYIFAYGGDGMRQSTAHNVTTIPFKWDHSSSLPLHVIAGTTHYTWVALNGLGGIHRERPEPRLRRYRQVCLRSGKRVCPETPASSGLILMVVDDPTRTSRR
jgi:hypothetical protein